MKKYRYFIFSFLSFIGVLFCTNNLQATHYMGSEIYYERVSATRVRVVVKIYRKCCEDANAKCAPANPANFVASNLDVEELCLGGASSTVSMNQDSVVDVTPSCDEGCSQCGLEGDNTPPCPPEAINPSDPNYDPDLVYDFGIEVYFFSTVITIDTSKCANYRFSWSSCCRNGDITTGVSGGFYTEATADLSVINNSPRFDKLPVTITCAGQDYVYAQSARDLDYDAQGRLADSIVYSLAEPQASSGPLSFSAPYNFREPLSYVGAGPQFNPGERRMPSAPLPPNYPEIDFRPIKGFILDSVSGDFLFHPTQAGERSVVTVKIEEYRDGKLISEIRRDLQFIIDGNCTANNAPVIYGIDGTSDQSLPNFRVQACADAPVELNIIIHDEDYFRIASRLGQPDAKDSVLVGFETNAPGAKVRVRPSSQNKSIAILNFQWTPTSKNVSPLPYSLTIRAADDFCQPPSSARRTFLIYVNPKPEVDTLTQLVGCGEAYFEATQDTTGGASKARIITYQWRIEEPGVGTTVYPSAGYDKPGDAQRSKDTLRHGYIEDGRKPWTVEVTDANGCTNRYGDTIDIPRFPRPELGTQDTAICLGEALELQAQGIDGQPPYTLTWTSSKGDTLKEETVSSVSRLRLTEVDTSAGLDSITVTLSDNVGCTTSDFVRVFVSTPPQLDFSPAEADICASVTEVIDPSASLVELDEGDSVTSYRWYRIDDQTSDTILVSQDSLLEVGAESQYVLRVADTVGCAGIDTFDLDVNAPIDVTVNPPELCFGDSTVISVPNPGERNFQFEWRYVETAGDTQQLFGGTFPNNFPRLVGVAAQDSVNAVKLTPLDTGVQEYQVIITEPFKTTVCRADTVVKVRVKPLPEVSYDVGIVPFQLGPVCADSDDRITNLYSNMSAETERGGEFFTPDGRGVETRRGNGGVLIYDFDPGEYDTTDFGEAERIRVPLIYEAEKDGCTDRDTIDVVVNALPRFDPGMLEMCEGDQTLDLPVPRDGRLSYTWRDEDGGSRVVAGSQPASTFELQAGDNAGTYALGLDLLNQITGCANSQAFDLEVRPNLEPRADFSRELCLNDPPFLLEGRLAGDDTGRYEFSYQGPNAAGANPLSAEDTFDASIAGARTHQIQMVYITQYGCRTAEVVDVLVNPIPEVSFDLGTEELCEREEVLTPAVLQPAGGDFVDEQGSVYGFASEGELRPRAAGAGDYRIWYRYEEASTGCADSVRQDLRIDGQPEVSFTNQEALCPNEPFEFEAGVRNATGVRWLMSGNYQELSPRRIRYEPTRGELRRAQVDVVAVSRTEPQNDACAADTARVSAPIYEVPNLDLEQDVTASCDPAEVTFRANTDSLRLQWVFGDGTVRRGADTVLTHVYQAQDTPRTRYRGEVRLLDERTGCRDTVAMREVVVYRNPQAAFAINDPDTRELLIVNPTARFRNLSEGTYGSPTRYRWDFDDRTRSDDESSAKHPTWTYSEEDSTVEVSLEVTNVYLNAACVDDTSLPLNVKAFIQVFAPSAFSPQAGGQEVNDKWFAYTRAAQSVELSIYNRWGEAVYRTDELITPAELEGGERAALGELLEGVPNYRREEARITRPWDGVDQRTGQACEQGVYVYTITSSYEGKQYQFSGTVTLLR